jgi:hypothetical protein
MSGALGVAIGFGVNTLSNEPRCYSGEAIGFLDRNFWIRAQAHFAADATTLAVGADPNLTEVILERPRPTYALTRQRAFRGEAKAVAGVRHDGFVSENYLSDFGISQFGRHHNITLPCDTALAMSLRQLAFVGPVRTFQGTKIGEEAD